ncbi:MAG: hypothetical protein JXM69_04555 [Anaerolineae bacterium]|nr:hypothetical protein [Anaerolineae bacterium]
MDSRVVTVLAAMIFGLIILTCLCFATIYLFPDIPFNPLSPSRATAIAETRLASQPTQAPTYTLVPTYPPTWTPSPTATRFPTKTPTDTRTPTPTKTPTNTATATPTRTPTTVVPPTSTAAPPYPYAGASGENENRCDNIKLKYSVTGDDGEPAAGFQVEYGEIAVPGSVFLTEPTRYSEVYGVTLIQGIDRSAASSAHDWFAYLMLDGVKMSQAILFTTDPLYADNPSHCDDLDQDSTEFYEKGCIMDPCRSDDAINVKAIDFQPRVLRFEPFLTATPRPNLCSPPYADFIIPRTCRDCATQADAQRLFEIVGGPRIDIYDFDRDGNGIACEHLP